MITITTDRFTEKGLKPITKLLENEGIAVDKVEVSSRIIKKDGMPTKAVVYHIMGSRKLTILFAFKNKKALGITFQAKLGSSKLPITYKDTGTPQTRQTILKIAGMVKAKLSATAKRAAIKVNKKDLVLSQEMKKRVSKSTEAKLKESEAQVKDLQDTLDESRDELKTLESEIDDKQISELQQRLGSLEQEEAELKKELEKVEG
jgi:hypothetical protein